MSDQDGGTPPARVAVMAHFDPEGHVAPHTRRQVAALTAAFDEVIVVSTATLDAEARAWITERAKLIERENEGYDFYSYKVGLDALAPLDRFDEVVICNDSYVGPLRPYRRILDDMAGEEVDFWGLTGSREIKPHLQSFFVAFRPRAYGSLAFRRFWSDMEPLSDRTKVILRYEIGLTQSLARAGLRWSAYFVPTPEEIALARRRLQWWARHEPRNIWNPLRYPLVHRIGGRFNPSAILADSALDDGRLPFVKFDTLRYDVARLDAERLLTACEEMYPEAFEGVRAYLDRTDAAYRGRHGEQSDTPWVLRPFAGRVHYAPDRPDLPR